MGNRCYGRAVCPAPAGAASSAASNFATPRGRAGGSGGIVLRGEGGAAGAAAERFAPRLALSSVHAPSRRRIEEMQMSRGQRYLQRLACRGPMRVRQAYRHIVLAPAAVREI